jgi:hypothetical protein
MDLDDNYLGVKFNLFNRLLDVRLDFWRRYHRPYTWNRKYVTN